MRHDMSLESLSAQRQAGTGAAIRCGGEACLDTIIGFEPGRDRLAFPHGFLARIPHGAGPGAGLRLASGRGGCVLLVADTAAAGWCFVAEFAGTDRTALRRAIEGGALVADEGVSPSPGTR